MLITDIYLTKRLYCNRIFSSCVGTIVIVSCIILWQQVHSVAIALPLPTAWGTMVLTSDFWFGTIWYDGEEKHIRYVLQQ